MRESLDRTPSYLALAVDLLLDIIAPGGSRREENNPTMWKRWCGRTAAAPSWEPLPVDLLLEIIARTDVTTIVRCAATGRVLRRGILDPAFRRSIMAHHHGGFDPALLLGVSYRERGDVMTHRVIRTPGPAKLAARLDELSFPDPLRAVASRGNLLVLCRHLQGLDVKLRVCDAFTGHVTSLPPASLPDAYLHVVLSIGDAGRSFELLVADKNIQFHQTFSSKDGQWSAVHQVSVPHPDKHVGSYCSAVIGRTVYWPCHVHAVSYWDHVLALDLDAREAAMIKLPRGCFSRMAASKKNEHLHLASVRGRLCLLVAESCGIAMWTLTLPMSVAAAVTWSRQVLINNLEIARQVGFSPYEYALVPLSIEGFGERSGAVILSQPRSGINSGELLRLDLGTMEKAPVVTSLSGPGNVVRVERLFLHEVDLLSLLDLLEAMKHF
ncbi:hypothetical protein ACQJBY_051733 [Aegilops geniculata]